ncbi:MAG: hypothetical protein HKN25_02765 [Pyrinomonadaceae bacterium]|nr:hypothetical protein [Pyrinomonadaceae bacterium]
MRGSRILKLITLFVLTLAAVSTTAAQSSDNPPDPASPPKGPTKVMGKNETLPFMKSESAEDEEAPTSGGLLLKTLGAMMLIIGLVFFGAWGLKRLGFGSNAAGDSSVAPELSILSSVSAGSGRTLSVVRFGTRSLLVGSTAQTFTLLADETGSEFEFPSDPTPRSVADLLADENASFEEELSRANNRLHLADQYGGRTS